MLSSNDYIIRIRDKAESKILELVKEANLRLRSKNHPAIKIRIGDPYASETLYGESAEKSVLLNEHLYLDHENIIPRLLKLPFSLYGAHYMPKVNWDISIEKKFNWFTRRNDPNRQYYFYHLYKNNWLDLGFVSFLNIPMGGNESSIELFNSIHRDYYSPQFDQIYTNLRSMIPYRNFQETGNLCDIVMKSKFSIVVETYIERTDVICFSEKIFRCLQLPRPWLLLGATGSIKLLRDLGFYVFDDFVDHSYDSIDTQISTARKHDEIMRRVEHLFDLPVTDSIIDHWKIQTRKNQILLKEWNLTYVDDCRPIIQKAEEMSSEQYNG